MSYSSKWIRSWTCVFVIVIVPRPTVPLLPQSTVAGSASGGAAASAAAAAIVVLPSSKDVPNGTDDAQWLAGLAATNPIEQEQQHCSQHHSGLVAHDSTDWPSAGNSKPWNAQGLDEW